MKIKCLIILSVLFFGGALADPWSGTTTITRLYPYSDGLIFNTQYKNEILSSCDGGTRFQISKIHPNYEVLVSAMMAAFMADKKITFNIDSGQNKVCQPTINRFQIIK